MTSDPITENDLHLSADGRGPIRGPERSARTWSANSRGPLFPFRQRRKEKGPAASYSRTGGSRTTLGDEALDFSVRNGNWYFCLSMATGLKGRKSGTKETCNAREGGEPFESHIEVK